MNYFTKKLTNTQPAPRQQQIALRQTVPQNVPQQHHVHDKKIYAQPKEYAFGETF
jgi:hypothetical protein